MAAVLKWTGEDEEPVPATLPTFRRLSATSTATPTRWLRFESSPRRRRCQGFDGSAHGLYVSCSQRRKDDSSDAWTAPTESRDLK